LLGPGIGIVNGVLGPAAGTTRSLTWVDQAAQAPEDAFVRTMTALGLVLSVRLGAALLLALASRVPGRTGLRAARMSFYLTPPRARRLMSVLISVGLSSGTGAALSAPAFAATQPVAVVVPTPLLAPPEATLRTWPDLGRPGTDVSTSPAPVSPSPSHQPAMDPPGGRSTTARQPDAPVSATQPSPGPSAIPATRPAAGKTPTTDVVVTTGDCLWTLAERDLERRSQAEPTASAIAAATEKWWQSNRVTIGANPDRLMPGQRLTPPR
jgi:hypothetical protein